MSKPDTSSVVLKRGDRFFVSKRSENKSYAGLYQFPGGKIDEGETARKAALRELKEECGLVVDEDRLKFLFYSTFGSDRRTIYYFVLELTSGENPSNLEPDKQTEWEQMTLEQLEKVNVMPNMFRAAKTSLGRL